VPQRLVIVARNREVAYRYLRQTFANDAGVHVILDRRVRGDRRRATEGVRTPERRKAERRRRPDLGELLERQGRAVVLIDE
jgi:hypothetical protein